MPCCAVPFIQLVAIICTVGSDTQVNLAVTVWQAVPGFGWLYAHTRKVRLRGPTVDDACEWAIALREAIQEASKVQ